MTRLEVMQRLKEKWLSQAEASGMLGISVRQVRRFYAVFRKAGAGSDLNTLNGFWTDIDA